MFSLKTAIALTAAVVGIAAGGVASAQEVGVLTYTVRYNPSQLDTDAGTRRVYSRLVLAAEKVCPQQSNSHIVTSAVIECRKQAIAGAVEKIHNSRLAALSAARLLKAG
jgi:UrcA family protein